jgi:hypothetical protein
MSARSIAWMATAAFALAGWLWLATTAGASSADGPERTRAAEGVAPPSSAPRAAAAAPTPTPTPALAPTHGYVPARARTTSLAGTDIDGTFTIGDDGRFVPDRQTLRLFNYFLSTEGERDAADIRDDVQQVARTRLSPDDADRALALYDRYLAYRAALATALSTGEAAPGDLPAATAIAARVRVDTFGVVDAERLFAPAAARSF